MRLPRVNLRKLERRYAARVKLILQPLQEIIERELFPALDIFTQRTDMRLDDEVDAMADVFRKIKTNFEVRYSTTLVNREITRTAEEVSNEGADVHRRQLKTVLGVDPVQAEPWIHREVNAFVKQNASLISSIPAEYLSDIEQLVFREGRRSSFKDMKAKIKDLYGATEARAELIARDQVSKFNGKLTELRQVNVGITTYIWRTSKDGRVRSTHQHLDGTEHKWNDPPVTVKSGKRAGEKNHPGEDIQCRCYAEPVIDDLIERKRHGITI